MFDYFGQTEGLCNTLSNNVVRGGRGCVWGSVSKNIQQFDGKQFLTFNSSLLADVERPIGNAEEVFPLKNGRLAMLRRDNGIEISSPLAAYKNDDAKKDTVVNNLSNHEVVFTLPETSRKIKFSVTKTRLNGSTPLYYRLLPLQKKWGEMPENDKLNLNYLSPGDYQLQLGFHPGSVSFETRFKAGYFLYENWWFRVLVVIVFLIMVTYLIYSIFDRRLAREKARQWKDNERFRHRLFTYIVEEFKTPLTVIKGVSDNLKYADLEDKWGENIDSLQRQSRKMNELVEQMMELNQIDTGSWKPVLVKADIPVVVGRICSQLLPLAEEMKIGLKCDSSVPSSFQLTEVTRLNSILNNLIANALKYSPENTEVNLFFEKTEREWSIMVRDQGPGVREGDITHIFELLNKGGESFDKRMSQSGIGLAYVKSTVEALDGRLEVNNDGEGTVYKVIFPIKETEGQFEKDNREYEIELKEQAETDGLRNVSILVVEDTEEVAQYIRICLDKEEFKVSLRKDGVDGLKYAMEQIPDLVISDIRMPKMGGFELVQKLKNNELTNHIPIIMLTALSDESNRLKGLEVGADAYVTKPFNVRELILTIDNILNTIEKQKSLLVHELTGGNGSSEEEQVEKEYFHSDFIRKVNQCLEKNYANSRFGIVEMAAQLQMSRIQLNRKVNSVSGLNPSDMLRKYRLNQAAKMLDDKSLNISEIAYVCGFSDPSYFSKLFMKEFGQPPTAYRKKP